MTTLYPLPPTLNELDTSFTGYLLFVNEYFRARPDVRTGNANPDDEEEEEDDVSRLGMELADLHLL